MAIDFDIPPEAKAIRERVRQWVHDECIPAEKRLVDGEVWFGESRLISHQIYYGESAAVYMWFVNAASMADPNRRFNHRLESLHREMQSRAESAPVAA